MLVIVILKIFVPKEERADLGFQRTGDIWERGHAFILPLLTPLSIITIMNLHFLRFMMVNILSTKSASDICDLSNTCKAGAQQCFCDGRGNK